MFDSIGKIVKTVDNTTSGVERTINTAERTKRVGDKLKGGAEKVNTALQKKCKQCGALLKTDAEKNAEMCANCALKMVGSK